MQCCCWWLFPGEVRGALQVDMSCQLSELAELQSMRAKLCVRLFVLLEGWERLVLKRGSGCRQVTLRRCT